MGAAALHPASDEHNNAQNNIDNIIVMTFFNIKMVDIIPIYMFFTG